MSNKLKQKATRPPVKGPYNLTNFQTKQIADMVGTKRETLEVWLKAREKEIADATVAEFNEKLHRAEDHAALVNLLICMYAIKMTWGFTKAQERFISNLNASHEYVRRTGIKKAFEQILAETGADLEFDDFEIEDIIKQLGEREIGK